MLYYNQLTHVSVADSPTHGLIAEMLCDMDWPEMSCESASVCLKYIVRYRYC